ncbi:GtrA family protein [Clostridium felsineum]|uniref:GtrA family protein n=1 Tax=Clostridium felsineum TaxID=36839 RepID=UPI00111573AD|nr:GtrA family protein [Clostridium felsineum]
MLMLNKVGYIFNGRLKQISRFSAVGVINTLIDFVMFTLFNSVIGVGYSISQVIGYGSGVINSFIFNKKWTFSDKAGKKKLHKELIRFIFINVITLLVTLVSMNLFVKGLGINVYVAKILVTLIAQAINFLGYKILVFS